MMEEQAAENVRKKGQRDAKAAKAKQIAANVEKKAQEATTTCQMLLRYLQHDPGFARYVAAQEHTLSSIPTEFQQPHLNLNQTGKPNQSCQVPQSAGHTGSPPYSMMFDYSSRDHD